MTGGVQVVKTELQAATGLQDGSWLTKAQTVAASNIADMRAVTLQSGDVTAGRFQSGVFTANTTPFNAVRVVAVRNTSRGNAVRLSWMGVFGVISSNVTVTSIAVFSPASSQTITVGGGASTYFAGLPAGTQYYDAWGSDDTTTQAPVQSTLALVPGSTITFATSGTVGYSQWETGINNGPDGASGTNAQAHTYGVSNCIAPNMALMGVFLTNQGTVAGQGLPSTLDFSSQAARDQGNISPELKQTFFIGSGVTSTGASRTVTVPEGATRLFLGTNDYYVWRDNWGSFTVTITNPSSVSLVR